jgi:hypothetical protein
MSAGSGLVFLMMAMGEHDGNLGSWSFHKGGNGGFAQVLASAARSYGAEIRLEAPVDHVLTRDGRAVGVVLTDGTEFHADIVVSSLDPRRTFTELVDPRELPTELVERLARAVERRRAGLDELEKRRRDLDLRVGQRTRVFVISILGLVWTATPFLAQFGLGRDDTNSPGYLALPIVSLLILGGLAIWARESLTRTLVNRTVVATLALALIAQLLLMLGGCALVALSGPWVLRLVGIP